MRKPATRIRWVWSRLYTFNHDLVQKSIDLFCIRSKYVNELWTQIAIDHVANSLVSIHHCADYNQHFISLIRIDFSGPMFVRLCMILLAQQKKATVISLVT